MDASEALKVRELLSQWGVDKPIHEEFIKQGIDLMALEFMDKTALEAFFPQHGPRIKFNVHRENWVKSRNLNESSSNVTPRAGDTLTITDINGNLCVDERLPLNFMSGDNLETPAQSEVIVIVESEVGSSPKPETLQPTETEKESAVKSTGLTLQSVSPNTSDGKRFKSYDLKAILKGSSEGQKVMACYKKDGSFVKDSTRDALVDCVLDEETHDDLGKSLSRDRLRFLSQQIVLCFPSERQETYFHTEMNVKTGKKVTKGKLVWRFYNRRRSFVNSGAIPKPTSKSSSASKCHVSRKTNVEIPTGINSSLCWLKENRGNSGNWETVLRHWRSTSKTRMDLIDAEVELTEMEAADSDDESNDTNSASTSQKKPKKKSTPVNWKKLEHKIQQKAAGKYMNEYPAFQENTGYMLMEIDFHTLHPEVEPLILFSEWGKLSAFIVEQVRLKNPNFLDDTTLTNGEKNLMILRNFPKLFPVVTLPGNKKGKTGKKTWRPSHAEVADSFVLLVPNTLALEENKEVRREKLLELRMHMQPFVAVIGEPENPIQFLVCINEFFYEVDNVLQAVDIVFKSFFALQLFYPPEAEQLWMFIQRAVYQFTTKEDISYEPVNNKAVDYSRFKAKQGHSV